ncbi:MAG: protein kinase [Acidobacteria bacterium]|nr:protein kinase [Acidobacteriota bacterium]
MRKAVYLHRGELNAGVGKAEWPPYYSVTVPDASGRPDTHLAAPLRPGLGAQSMFIGQYEVVRTLGRGGMGSVYVARDPAIDRLVAIKLLKDGIDSPEVRERFKREARSAGKLRHPNIVTIFHVGDHESRPYIVMEYIPGETLAELIRKQTPMTLARKLRIIDELCRGLAYAHRAGIVHRDVKPLNILVDTEGAVKILDFGIARVGEQGLTQLGMMMGTPNYMAPEQISPGTADARSDVFAVGLVLYELLTYKRAFPGDDFSVLQKILQDEPEPIERLCPGIDSEVVQVLKRAIAKRPDDRYQDLGAMRQELVRIWSRVKTPDDEASGEIGPITPTDTRYDGPTLVPGVNESIPAAVEQQRASDLARELARVAEEKRKAEQSAQTPPLGTPRTVGTPADAAPVPPSRDAAPQQAPASGSAASTRPPAPPSGPSTPTAKAPAADPTITGPKKPPVTYTSTSEPTMFVRRPDPGGAKPPAPKPPSAATAEPTMVMTAASLGIDKPPAPPSAATGAKSSTPPLPPGGPTPHTKAQEATTQKAPVKGAAPAPTAQGPTRALPPWLIPVAALALLALLLLVRMLLAGGPSASTAAPESSTTERTSAATGASPGTTGAGSEAVPSSGADVAAVRTRVNEAIARGDVEGAMRLLQDAPAAAAPALASVSSALVDAARNATTLAFDQAQAAGAAQRATDDYKQALSQRADADAAVQSGKPLDAARAYLEATAGFTRAMADAKSAAAQTAAATAAAATASAATATPNASSAAAPRAASRPQPSAAADTASIETLLQQYADAYSRMDVTGVRAVWPGAPGNLSFAGIKSYNMTVRNPQVSVTGDRATVTAVRHTVQELEGGRRQEASPTMTFNLRRVGGGWVIDTIQ